MIYVNGIFLNNGFAWKFLKTKSNSRTFQLNSYQMIVKMKTLEKENKIITK